MRVWLLAGLAVGAAASEEVVQEPIDLGPPARLIEEVSAWESALPVEGYPFSEATLEVLETVQRSGLKVRIRAFFRPRGSGWTEPGRDERVRVAMGRLLEAAAHRYPALTLENHDVRSPLARSLGVRENGVYELEARGRRVVVLAGDLEYLHTLSPRPGVPKGVVERVALFRGEEALASGLQELLDGRVSSVCFSTGHGEGDPTSQEPGGFARVAQALERGGRAVERWEPVAAEEAPERCGVVAMVGPRRELGAPTREWLEHHLRSRRPFVLLLDAGAPATELQSVLSAYGLELTDNRLIEPHPAFRSPSDPLITLPDLNGHFITQSLLGARQLVGLREVRGIRYGPRAQVAADVRTILQSSPQAWGETQHGPAPRKSREDLWPPVSAAVAVSSKLGANDALRLKEEGELRLAVVGDTAFATNEGLDRATGNLDFFLRVVHWVSREPPQVSVAPVPVRRILR